MEEDTKEAQVSRDLMQKILDDDNGWITNKLDEYFKVMYHLQNVVEKIDCRYRVDTNAVMRQVNLDFLKEFNRRLKPRP